MPLLCRTLALNCLHNYVLSVYEKPSGLEHEVLSLCCVAKTLMGWNFLKTATTCRERCGGMGYLAVSRFGEYIALAHSALTAEGDNRVLMTKIAKDYLTNVAKKLSKPPATNLHVQSQIGTFSDVTQLSTLIDLFRFRETTLFEQLRSSMAKLRKQGRSSFEILMRECSDNIQALAMAYGERITVEQCGEGLSKMKNNENKKVLETVFRVFAIDALQKDLGFFLKQKAVNSIAARAAI